jgi:hypothetical protein
MKTFCFFCLFLFVSFSLPAQHVNVMVSNSLAPEEPSIMMNPKDPRYIVAGSNIRSAFYSSDTGRTWSQFQLSSSLGVYGDPMILCDTTGAFYYFHLSDPPGTPWIEVSFARNRQIMEPVMIMVPVSA